MTIDEILLEGQRSLVLFDRAGIAAVEALLTEKTETHTLSAKFEEKKFRRNLKKLSGSYGFIVFGFTTGIQLRASRWNIRSLLDVTPQSALTLL